MEAPKKILNGWKEKKVLKEDKKSTKTIEKTIEKESEKEAQQIVDIKSIANDLALNIIKANSQLETYIVRNKKKTKKVKYDYKVSKPSEEETTEEESLECMEGIIDRQGLKMLASALKDLNEILTDKKENNFSNINQNIQNIAYLINNPQKVRTEDDIDE